MELINKIDTIGKLSFLYFHRLSFVSSRFVSRRLFVESVETADKFDVIGKSEYVAYYSGFQQIKYIFDKLCRSKNEFDSELAELMRQWMPHIETDTSTTFSLTTNAVKAISVSAGQSKVKTALELDNHAFKMFELGKPSPTPKKQAIFRLGDLGEFRNYENQYVVNSDIALTKKQFLEEKDKRKTLSNKFCVNSPFSKWEIQWNPSVLSWTSFLMTEALKQAILDLEQSIPSSSAFFMPAWLSTSLAPRWRRALSVCSSPRHFALSLLILESNLRLLAFQPVWFELGGHFRLDRVTQQDREDYKVREQIEQRLQRKAARQERALERAMMRQASANDAEASKVGDESENDSENEEDEQQPQQAIKFSKKPKHCIWKQKGEEYRILGGGWSWVRSGRRKSSFISRNITSLKDARESFGRNTALDHQLTTEEESCLEVSDGLRSRKAYATVPNVKAPFLDTLLEKRMAMVGDIDDQKTALLQLIDPLLQGRKLADFFPPAALPLPESLPPCIRHLPITLDTSAEELVAIKDNLIPPTNDTIKLKWKKSTKKKKFAVHRFVPGPGAKPNIFCLPPHSAHYIARKAGLVEIVPGFFHPPKDRERRRGPPVGQMWYGGIAARPSFRVAWEFRSCLLSNSYSYLLPQTFAAVACQLKSLAACLRFNDMNEEPPLFPTDNCIYTESQGNMSSSREIQGARLHSRELRRFEYLCKITKTNIYDGSSTIEEQWLPDNFVNLWEARYFHERLSRVNLTLLAQGRVVTSGGEGESPSKKMKVVSPTPAKQGGQEVEICQLPSGEFQVKGLGQNQFMFHGPDGSFQFIALSKQQIENRIPPKPPTDTPLRKLRKSPAKFVSPEITSDNVFASENNTPVAKSRTPKPGPKSSKKKTASKVPSPAVEPSPEIKVETTATPLQNVKKRKRHSSVNSAPRKATKSNTPVPKVSPEPPAPEPVELAPQAASDEIDPNELYCICQTPYDPTLFYIGCEKCGEWFHGSCVGVTEEDAQYMDDYCCDKCRQAAEQVKAEPKPSDTGSKRRQRKPKEEKVSTPKPQKPAKEEKVSTPKSVTPTPPVEKVKTPEPPVEKPRGRKSTRVVEKSPLEQPPPSPTAAASVPKPKRGRKSKKAVEAAAPEPDVYDFDNNGGDNDEKEESQELYCICKTPYDDKEFYIGCDGCGEWYHGACVFVAECEATWIVNWLCPRCSPTKGARSIFLAKDAKIKESTEKLLQKLIRHKKSWPFRSPVDRELYPNYYQVIRHPVDLSLIGSRLKDGTYETLEQFKYDILLMFDNCRKFNMPDSKFYQCAEELQQVFLEDYRSICPSY